MFLQPAQRLLHDHANHPERWRNPLYNIIDKFLDGLMSLVACERPDDPTTSILVWLLETGPYWGEPPLTCTSPSTNCCC